MTTRIQNPVRHAIGKALTNDDNGTVSAKDAKAILNAAVGAIKKAKDPEKTYETARADLKAAERFLGRTGEAKETLQSFDQVGRSAVAMRLEQITGNAQLPLAVRDNFLAFVKDHELATGQMKLTNVKGNETLGFSFTWTAGGQAQTAYAVPYLGNYVFSPEKVTKANLDAATKAFQAYFDAEWAPELRDNGNTAAEVRAMRAELKPTHVFFKGQSDPNNLVDSYPLVFSFNNPTGSDHGLYCGLNPRSGETEAYTFN